MPVSNQHLTALILAGGRATRMGGRDKGLIEVDGKSFAELLAEQLAGQVDAILINANRNLELYRKIGFPVISDSLVDFQGPLAGMLSGLQSIESGWLLTVPCDGPTIPADYARRMLSMATKDGNLLAVASDGHRLQPVYALIHCDLAESLARFLDGADRKIDRWYAGHPFSAVSFADHNDMFVNVNRPEDLQKLRHRAT